MKESREGWSGEGGFLVLFPKQYIHHKISNQKRCTTFDTSRPMRIVKAYCIMLMQGDNRSTPYLFSLPRKQKLNWKGHLYKSICIMPQGSHKHG